MFRKRTPQERFWEILPGLQFWLVFFGAIILSYSRPVWASIFIICFDLYWVLKAMNVASHLLASYRKFQEFVKIDWLDYVKKLENLENLKIFFENKLKIPLKVVEKYYYQDEVKRLGRLIAQGKKGMNFQEFFH